LNKPTQEQAHLQFARATLNPKIAKELTLPTLTKRKYDPQQSV